MNSDFVKCVEDVLKRELALIDSELSVRDKAREEAIITIRSITRLSGEATRLMHLGRFSEALAKINETYGYVAKLHESLSKYPDLYYSGLTYNGLAEYVEAYVLYRLIVEKRIPSLNEINVPPVPYLQGLGDVIGEVRRYVLDLLNSGNVEDAETYVKIMEAIYYALRTLNYPDALVPGLRHKVDTARKLIDDTKNLVIYVKSTNKVLKRGEKSAAAGI